MSPLVYMRLIIFVAIVVFSIGIYKNLIKKIIHILQVQEPDEGHEPRKVLPVLKLSVTEVVLQWRIRNRSQILWIRHLMIFGGFFTFFILELLIGMTKSYPSFNFILPAFNVLLDLSGGVLILGLIIAIVHWIIYKEKEQHLIDITSLILLAAVVISGLVSAACRNLISPEGFSIMAPVQHGIAQFSRWTGYPLEKMHYWLYLFHITMAAAVIAYIPFCKLIHIFAVPIGRIATMGKGYGDKKRAKVSEGLL